MRLALIGPALAALSACATPHRDTFDSEYLARRTAYAKSLTARYQSDSERVAPAESLALRDLEGRLRELIGPLEVTGVADSGRINLTTLLPGDVDSGLADGLVYTSADQHTRMFVTTRGILRWWLADEFATDSTVPRDPLAALTREKVYTQIFEGDAAVVRYADLPVTSPHKRVIAAMLVDRQQDYCLTCVPTTILIGVSAGDRIFVVDTPARDTIAIPKPCSDSAAADKHPQESLDNYLQGGHSDSTLFNESMRAESQRFDDLRACYGREVRSDPRFAAIVAQARAVVDALPDR